ncbi:carbohydrate ABC transporter permease [Microbacterium sp. ASV49]|uniref:Carbohydrate ABC transporter permease n=1 Tax=Microbacterium candidum TaxID=3041922 RepID=A0ABT7N234_9MICO|nr:carbohydrate ABC transporter permease [Microbacterium sp. ASV49]MDL9980747.1 carbohydrate ABC transporter permease [Microbacterium sp. ASV49]
MRAPRGQVLSYVILYVFAVFAIYPLISTILVAFNSPNAAVSGLAWPSPWTLDSFIRAWTDTQAGIGRSMLNSLILAIAVVPISVVFSIFTGYSFGTMRFRGSGVLFALLLLGLIVPYEATIIPLYYEFRAIGLLDTYWAMILPDIGGSMAFGTLWMAAFFRAFPRELIDSAHTDGATRWQTLWKIIVPTAGSPIFALATILFIWTWNNLLLAIVMITNPQLQMAPAALNFFVGLQYGANYQVTCAAAIIVALPVMLIYYILQRRYGSDVLAGAVKG